jgi:general secretion pathway protein I
MTRRPSRLSRLRGFTLVEVMLALAILGLALVILVRSVAGNITAAQDSFYMGIATDLARGKMLDVEEDLLQEGFQETEQEEEGDFSDEGWDTIKWKVKVEPVELPSFEVLMGLANGQAGEGQGSGSGSGTGSGEGEGEGESQIDKFQSSALGGMLGMLGMGGGGSSSEGSGAASQQATAGFLQSQYTLVQQVLKQAIRKITLEVSYDTGVHKESFKTILYVTDAAGMQKVLGSLGWGS